MSGTTLRPVNQRRRINALRLLFLALLPLLLFTRTAGGSESLWADVAEQVGVFLVIFAVLGRFWAILYSGGAKNSRIVREGPYSICRHPLYLFSTLGVAGLGMMSGSVVIALVLTVCVGVVLAATARFEEEYLRTKFGQSYADYAARVPMILPSPRLYTSPPRIEVALRPLLGNFFDALVFLSFIPLAEILEGVKESGHVPTFPLW